mmetsp:Transcript_62779/g.173998  ORF Transcript_62779/g.173998 Transcript_62779/m.173998 type:complete len:572 (+) Transcript_62779:44-1759(+)
MVRPIATFAWALLTCSWLCIASDEFKNFRVPWPTDAKFDPTGRFHNWCNLEDRVLSEEGPHRFKNALAGRNVSVVIMNARDSAKHWLDYDQNSGNISGGYLIKILDEVSLRAGFEWRGTLAVVEAPNSSENETYDSWLSWATDNYDLVVGTFAGTADRRAEGFRFGFPFLDSSPSLVGVLKQPQDSLLAKIFSWHKPFRPDLWLSILISFVVTGVCYYMIEGGQGDFEQSNFFRSVDEDSDQVSLLHHLDAIYHSIMLTMLSFTGGNGFKPLGQIGKIFIFSWTFCVLLLVAGYTANLASFLTQSIPDVLPITSLEDAIQRHQPICVYPGGAYDKFMRERYPTLTLEYPKKWGYHNIREGKCAAMVKDAFYFLIDKGRKAKNKNCDLAVIGEPILQVSSSFVSKARPDTCPEMVHAVINAVMHMMYNDGWFDAAQEQFVSSECDLVCDPDGGSNKDGQKALGVEHLGGIFATHGILSIVCLVGHWCLEKPKARAKSPESTTSPRVLKQKNSYVRAAQHGTDPLMKPESSNVQSRESHSSDESPQHRRHSWRENLDRATKLAMKIMPRRGST